MYEVHDSSVTLRHTLPLEKAIELSFSPRGSYLSTWERPVKSEEGDRVSWSKNLRVWDTATGAQIAEFERRQLDGCFFQFTEDESRCVRLAGSELQVYDPQQLTQGPVGRLRAENIGAFRLGPGARPSVAVFFPRRRARRRSSRSTRWRRSRRRSRRTSRKSPSSRRTR